MKTHSPWILLLDPALQGKERLNLFLELKNENFK
jgi:hypothetical protein